VEDCCGGIGTGGDGGGAMVREEGRGLVEGGDGGMVNVAVWEEEGFGGRVLREDEHGY